MNIIKTLIVATILLFFPPNGCLGTKESGDGGSIRPNSEEDKADGSIRPETPMIQTVGKGSIQDIPLGTEIATDFIRPTSSQESAVNSGSIRPKTPDSIRLDPFAPGSVIESPWKERIHFNKDPTKFTKIIQEQEMAKKEKQKMLEEKELYSEVLQKQRRIPSIEKLMAKKDSTNLTASFKQKSQISIKQLEEAIEESDPTKGRSIDTGRRSKGKEVIDSEKEAIEERLKDKIKILVEQLPEGGIRSELIPPQNMELQNEFAALFNLDLGPLPKVQIVDNEEEKQRIIKQKTMEKNKQSIRNVKYAKKPKAILALKDNLENQSNEEFESVFAKALKLMPSISLEQVMREWHDEFNSITITKSEQAHFKQILMEKYSVIIDRFLEQGEQYITPNDEIINRPKMNGLLTLVATNTHKFWRENVKNLCPNNVTYFEEYFKIFLMLYTGGIQLKKLNVEDLRNVSIICRISRLTMKFLRIYNSSLIDALNEETNALKNDLTNFKQENIQRPNKKKLTMNEQRRKFSLIKQNFVIKFGTSEAYKEFYPVLIFMNANAMNAENWKLFMSEDQAIKTSKELLDNFFKYIFIYSKGHTDRERLEMTNVIVEYFDMAKIYKQRL